MKPKIKLLVNFVLIALLSFHFASAALVRCGTGDNPNPCGLGDLVDGVFVIINFLLGSVTLVTIGYILYGGVRMVLAAGNEDEIKNAKATMTNAIYGLIIVILAFLIVTSVTSYLTGRSLDDLRKNFFKF